MANSRETESLVSGTDVDAIDNWGKTPLIRAAQSDNIAEVTRLIKAGANVNAASDFKGGVTSLLMTGDPAIVSLLLKAEADPNLSDKTGHTPLMHFCGLRIHSAVSELIAAGANLNAQDENGTTALMQATYTGDVNTVSILINAGADVNARTKHDFSALMQAAVYAQNPEIVSMLIKAGAAVNAESNFGTSALSHTTDPSIKKILIENGAFGTVGRGLNRVKKAFESALIPDDALFKQVSSMTIKYDSAIDTDKDGKLDPNELNDLIRPLRERGIKKVFDVNDDGKIDATDLTQMLNLVKKKDDASKSQKNSNGQNNGGRG